MGDIYCSFFTTSRLLLCACSDSEGENPQPIKRSRSDQSLTATAQLAAAAAAGGSSGSGGAASQQYGLTNTLQSYGASQQLGCVALNGATYSQGQFGRAQRMPSLPVVLSDVGSSTNSLLSLDSEATRSVSQQHLNLMHASAGHPESPAAAAAGQAALHGPLTRSISSGTADAITAALSHSQAATSSGSMPRASSRQHSSSGVLCSLNPVSSAASLTQAQLWARGYDMTRTTSDASLSSGGYSAALQQLGLPLTAYSPPPLLSPGPGLPDTALGADRETAAVLDALGLGSSGTGAFKPGLSIQQQKQASFQGPAVPAAPAVDHVYVTAALGSSSWGMRAVNSRDSLHSSESITSVEAGERLAGVRFGLLARPVSGLGYSPRASQVVKQGTAAGLSQLPPLSPPCQTGSGGSGAPGGLAEKRSTSLGNLGTASLGAGSGLAQGSSSVGSSSSRQASAGLGRPPVPVGSPAATGIQGWGSCQVTSPGLSSELSEGNLSTVPGESWPRYHASRVAGHDILAVLMCSGRVLKPLQTDR